MYDDAINQVAKQRPGLARLLDTRGSESIKQYLGSLGDKSNIHPLLLKTILMTRSLKGAAIQKLPNLAHTADHIGLLNHPFFWSAKAASQDNTILVLATSNVSPVNSSHPRGLSWHGRNLVEKRAHFIPLSWRRHAMYGVPALTKIEVDTFIIKLPEKIRPSLQRVSEQDTFHECTWLSDQICLFNQELWADTFGTSQALVYIELESIVNELLIQLLDNDTSTFSRLCSDSSLQKRYVGSFDSIPGAHTTSNQKGSQLFWLIDHSTRRRIPLKLSNGYLITPTGNKISLAATSLCKNLQNRTLMPTLALSYCILSAEFGLTLSGGFSQIDYLPKMINAWGKLFDAKTHTKADVFAGELGLVSLSNKKEHVLATFIDLLLYTDNIEQRLALVERASGASLQQGLSAISDELLQIIDPKAKTIKPGPAGAILHV
ncbi:hypothetical protein KC959_03225 [Candidatus Saccharibacteria bacterium]|nr:hypothetical protein [Candidatus Saccharibacteria bacterium]